MKIVIRLLLILCLVALTFTLGLTSQTNHKVIFEDNFDGTSSNNWFVGSNEHTKASIVDGVYRMENISKKKTSGWSPINVGLKQNDNYIIEFDVRQTYGPDNNGFGLIFGKKDAAYEYMIFNITGTGFRQLNNYENNKTYPLREWKKNNNVKLINEWNKVKIVRTRNVLDCYVNGKIVLTYGQYIEKGQNVILNIDKPGMVIEFDNFKVTTFDFEVRNAAGADKLINRAYLPFNTVHNERFCYVSTDGNTMYISQNQGEENVKIWVSEYDGNKWSDLKKFPAPINNNGGNSLISSSSDKNTIYLMNTYNADGTSKGGGISVSNKTKDGWEIPKTIEVDNLVNKNRYASYFFSSDNKILVMAVQPNVEDYDEQSLFVSFIKEDGSYTEPMDLGPTLNTLGMDFNPFLAPDSKTLYYSSTGRPGYGSADIWVTRRLDDTWLNWSEPENLGPNINSDGFELNLTLDAKGDFAYLASYDSKLAGYKGQGDIMKIELPEGAKPEPVVLVFGKVLNKNTNEPIAAKINYFDLTTGEEYGTAISDINTGDYSIVLPRGINYGFKSEATGYVSISENLDLTKLDRYERIEKNLYLVPIEVGQTIRLNNLFFETGEFALKESSNSELKNLQKLLELNPNMKIKIIGYTDNVGSDANNLTLSKNRANSVYEWLIAKNINKSKLSSLGMGEKQPVAPNDTEEGRQLNRRVEFTIIEK